MLGPFSMMQRRFPPPWSVEETDACFSVKDHNGQKLAYVYFEDEPGRRPAANHPTSYLEDKLCIGASIARHLSLSPNEITEVEVE
jgi:hypothetical protein